MGSSQSDQQGEVFCKADWQVIHANENSSIWQNRRDPTQRIQQFSLDSASEEESRREREMYYLRKNHPQLVAALFLSAEASQQFCSSSYQQKLYIERIPFRLSDIEHIPFPDFLHIYHQGLKGYGELANHIGFFAVEEDFIGINERGVAKIWMNLDFSRAQIVGGKVSQEAMVRNIIDIVDKNIDQTQIPRNIPSLKSYIYRNNEKIHFEEAISHFNGFIREFCNGILPQRLECIDRVGGIEAILNRSTLHTRSIPTHIQNQNVGIRSQNAAYINGNRPQLIDSQILNNQYQPVLRTQNPPQYQPAARLVPANIPQGSYNVQVDRLPPIEAIKDIRQPAATFYSYNPNRTQANSFLTLSPNGNLSEGGRFEERIVVVPTPNVTLSQPNHLVQNSVPPQFVQTVNQLVQPLNRNPPPEVRINPNLSKSSKYQAGNPISLQSFESISSILPQVSPNQIDKKQESIQPINNASQIAGRPAFNPTIPQSKTQNAFLPTDSRAFSKDSSMNQASTATKERYTVPSTPLPQSSTPAYNFTQNFQYKPPTQATQYFKYGSIQPVAKGISIDDGKSSSDFFKRLKETSNLGQTPNYDTFQFQPKASDTFKYVAPVQQYISNYKNPFSNSQAIFQSNHQSQSKIGQNFSEQQFGKNAVSNILPNDNSYQVNSLDIIRQPLQFENNLDMKYSIFKAEQPNYTYQPTYTYKSYQTNFDPDLLADMRNMKQ